MKNSCAKTEWATTSHTSTSNRSKGKAWDTAKQSANWSTCQPSTTPKSFPSTTAKSSNNQWSPPSTNPNPSHKKTTSNSTSRSYPCESKTSSLISSTLWKLTTIATPMLLRPNSPRNILLDYSNSRSCIFNICTLCLLWSGFLNLVPSIIFSSSMPPLDMILLNTLSSNTWLNSMKGPPYKRDLTHIKCQLNSSRKTSNTTLTTSSLSFSEAFSKTFSPMPTISKMITSSPTTSSIHMNSQSKISPNSKSKKSTETPTLSS